MRIYMDIDHVRVLLRELYEIQQHCAEMERQFRAEIEQLRHVWYGPSPNEYYTRQQEMLHSMSRYHAQLEEMIALLEREVQEYARADQQL